jgi:hypothetical protein
MYAVTVNHQAATSRADVEAVAGFWSSVLRAYPAGVHWAEWGREQDVHYFEWGLMLAGSNGSYPFYRFDTRRGGRLLLERNRGFSLPYWMIAVILGATPASWLWGFRRVRRRIRAGLCPTCGYDLRATPERCPECGAVPTAVR